MALRRFSKLDLDDQGQALTEYILLVAILVGFYVTILAGIRSMGLERRLTASIIGPFAAAYRYGHVKAKGYDDGGPLYHPRAEGGDNNFRMFLNPESSK